MLLMIVKLFFDEPTDFKLDLATQKEIRRKAKTQKWNWSKILSISKPTTIQRWKMETQTKWKTQTRRILFFDRWHW